MSHWLAGWWQVLLSTRGWRLEHKRLGLGERLTGRGVSGVAQELFSESIGDLNKWKEGPPFPATHIVGGLGLVDFPSEPLHFVYRAGVMRILEEILY